MRKLLLLIAVLGLAGCAEIGAFGERAPPPPPPPPEPAPLHMPAPPPPPIDRVMNPKA